MANKYFIKNHKRYKVLTSHPDEKSAKDYEDKRGEAAQKQRDYRREYKVAYDAERKRWVVGWRQY